MNRKFSSAAAGAIRQQPSDHVPIVAQFRTRSQHHTMREVAKDARLMRVVLYRGFTIGGYHPLVGRFAGMAFLPMGIFEVPLHPSSWRANGSRDVWRLARFKASSH